MASEAVCVGGGFGEGVCGLDVSCCFVGWSGRPVGSEASFFPKLRG